jgi:ribosomal protein S19
MYSTYSFLFQLDVRKKSLLKLSEPQRIRLFFVISEHFSLPYRRNQSSVNKKGLLSKMQLRFLSVKVRRNSVRITRDCVGLPLRVYSGNFWKTILVKNGIVGKPLRFFVLECVS